jgi:hypothetical protein
MAYVLVPVFGKDICSIIRKYELEAYRKEHKERLHYVHFELLQVTEFLREFIINMPYIRRYKQIDNLNYGYCKEEGVCWTFKRRYNEFHEEAIQLRKEAYEKDEDLDA